MIVAFPGHTQLWNLIFSLLDNLKYIFCGHVRKYVTLYYLLDNIFIRFGSELCGQVVCIPMGTNCAPLVADFIFVLLLERLHVVSFWQL